MRSTDLYLLLDASGSMRGRTAEVIKHHTEYLKQHIAEPDTYLSVGIFSSEQFHDMKVHWLCQWTPISEAKPLTADDYQPRWDTPLNDAVGTVLDEAVKNPDTDKLIIILTDGEENASTKYPGRGNTQLAERIAALDTNVWGIVYVGQDVNIAEGITMGVAVSNSIQTNSVAQSYAAADAATDNFYVNKAASRAQFNLTSKKTD